MSIHNKVRVAGMRRENLFFLRIAIICACTGYMLNFETPADVTVGHGIAEVSGTASSRSKTGTAVVGEAVVQSDKAVSSDVTRVAAFCKVGRQLQEILSSSKQCTSDAGSL